MTLQYEVPNSNVQEIISKLKDLSLAFTKQKVKGLKSAVLVDGKEKIVGATAIFDHLGVLEEELDSWYYCNC